MWSTDSGGIVGSVQRFVCCFLQGMCHSGMRYRQGKPFWFQTLQILLILLILPLPSFSYVEPFQVPSIYWHDTNSNFMAWLFTKASIRVLRAAHALVGASIRVCVSLSNLLTKRFYCFFFFGFIFIPFPFIFPTSTQQLPSVQRAGTEPVIFNLYVCLGVFVSGFFAIPFYSLSKNEVGITGVSVFGERLASSLRHRTHLDVQYTCRF